MSVSENLEHAVYLELEDIGMNPRRVKALRKELNAMIQQYEQEVVKEYKQR